MLHLFRRVIDTAPDFFPAGRRRAMERRYEWLASDEKAGSRAIEDAIIDAGREIWPYRRSFLAMHGTVGMVREKRYVLAGLSGRRVQGRYRTFMKKSGTYEDVWKGTKRFEKFFTPTERRQIITACLEADGRIMREVHNLCRGRKKGECLVYLGKYRQEQRAVRVLLVAFRALAERTLKWREEILNTARTFEAGWSGLEREVSAVELKAAIEYYKSMLKNERILSS